ncbi:CLUMA_CG016509, isoform A [Clunio marinus]|uniref:Sodium/potassium-transporting ATPase subunit beta-1-interacting protein n=1 Tax=Clunio marinus TaxID=568069 RepID=A0A1J1IV11_9DIPT|nr:CLUMA_CG016509, isoform A [Clunio marinus]
MEFHATNEGRYIITPYRDILTIIERQVFDFLGYMWAPILANFLHMIFIIFGFFGAYQFRAKYLISQSDILNFGTGSFSWFLSNGPGCKPIYSTNGTLEDPFKPIRPDRVDGCFLEYPYIEIIHSSVQNFLSLLGLIGAICIGCILWDDDDSFEFMGSDIKSPQHTSVHPMYVSYSSIPANGSASSTQINSKKDPNQFGVVLTSINNSNTNSLSSTYIKTHNYPSNISSPVKTHHPNQMQSPTHYKLIDHRQLSSSSSLSQYNSRHNLINKSASTQQIIKQNPSFANPNRSDIRYTEINSTTDDILSQHDDERDRDVDTNSVRSYGRPSSQASTAAASPIISNKLMATNLQQQQLISKNFGIHNPLNSLIHNNDDINGIQVKSKQQPIDLDFNNHHQHQHQQQYQQMKNQQQKLFNANNHSPPSRPDFHVNNKYLPTQVSSSSSPSPTKKSYIHSPVEKLPSYPQQQQQQHVTRSPNLNQMPRRRPPSHQQQQQQIYQPTQYPIHHPLELSHTNNNRMLPTNGNFCDQLRGDQRPLPPRYNLNQFIPEYNCPNPLPAIPPHMMQHPMYRVRSQDRISNRLKRQSGAHVHSGSAPHDSQRPRSFCNNMINYQDYKDLH